MIGAVATGSFEYNGVSLNDSALKLDVQQKPILDEAARTVVCIETVITAETVVQADAGTDDTLESIRSALTKAGQVLLFANKGFGDDLEINNGFNPASLRDVRWGPKPDLLSWKPIGNDKAAEIVWRVTTWLPPICSTSGQTQSRGLMALNYSASFSINDRGYTTRSITGYIEIAQTRNGRNLPDCADLYRHLISFPAPNDFHRIADYDTSLDKSRLDFRIVDRQIESRQAYPEGVVYLDVKHAARWSRANGQSMMLRNTIRGEIEMAANYPAGRALLHFLDICFRRIQKLRTTGTGVLLDAFDMEEDMFGLSFQASLSYRVLASLADILKLGFWESLGTDSSLWKSSMSGVFSERGLADMRLNASDDVIVDLCNNTPPQLSSSQTYRPNDQQATPNRYGNEKPDPKQSWLQYQNQVQPYYSKPATRQSYMQTPETDQSQDDMNATNGYQLPASGGTDDVIQKGGRPRYSVTLVGGARRVGYQIPRPVLAAVGNQTPVEVNAVFNQWSEGDHFGVEVFGAAWAIEYMLPNSPGSAPIRPQLTDGGQTGSLT